MKILSKNNDISIFQNDQFSEIRIIFKKSLYLPTITFNIMILLIFWFIGYTIIGNILDQTDTGSNGFFVIWLLGLSYVTYRTIEIIIWLIRGRETIEIDCEKITINKLTPIHFFSINYQLEQTIRFVDINRIHYSEYYCHRSKLPNIFKGTIFILGQLESFSFGINLTQQDAKYIFKEIQKFVDIHHEKIG